MYGHWNIKNVGEFDPDMFWGFIYEIVEKDTGKSYIGKKQFTFKRQKTKYDKRTRKESDWKTYCSSSKIMQDLIVERGKENFEFNILSLCVGKSQLTYEEQQYQFSNDVLRAKFPNGERKYYNQTIGHMRFAGVEKQTNEAVEKIRLGNLGKKRTDEMRENYSKAFKGKKKTKAHKEALRLANLGKTYGEETKRKKSLAMKDKLWYNDGKINKRLAPEDEIPIGFVVGRLPTGKTNRYILNYGEEKITVNGGWEGLRLWAKQNELSFREVKKMIICKNRNVLK